MLSQIRRFISGFFLVLAGLVTISQQPDGAPFIITVQGITAFIIFLVLALLAWPAKLSDIVRAVIDEITTPSS